MLKPSRKGDYLALFKTRNKQVLCLRGQTAAAHPESLEAEHFLATSLSNLVGLFSYQGKYAEVEHLVERALSIRERILGAEHPDTAASLNHLAILFT